MPNAYCEYQHQRYGDPELTVNTCLTYLASGASWSINGPHSLEDLCEWCTKAVIKALEAVHGEPLEWSDELRDNAGGDLR